ncbi:RHS repeat-associated core domain-containing protein [Spartinivicinus poritis]|uniref:Polymorphic toxin-type HINT domain-containing protein n=1 Tax=Spartinivicinus poritis TaxID=2994640 RepID=A0ABT5U5U3_9GAMM|nr:RHS repeat-associated core domain-containing protein [Spartinivicinus sp. A2-2]MDE1461737.1 polymorphic toxin-type HINT domain-containing protein [Spartinivicinus sp. A2-2]
MNKISSIALAVIMAQGLASSHINAATHKDVAPLDRVVVDAITQRNSSEITLYSVFRVINEQASQTLTVLNKVKEGTLTDKNFIKRYFAKREANAQLAQQITNFTSLKNELESFADSSLEDSNAVVGQVDQSLDALTQALNKITATSSQESRVTALNEAINLLQDLQSPVDQNNWFNLPANPYKSFESIEDLVVVPAPAVGEPPAYVQQPPKRSSRRKRSIAYAEAPLHLNNNPARTTSNEAAPNHSGAGTCYADGNIKTGDLDAAPDVQITDEIKQLAKKLDYSPIKIFEYVSNKVSFEPYRGSVKGTNSTLWSKAGNDVDQASLLIALLRASNIPAHYVRGNVFLENKPEHLNWLKVKKINAAFTVIKRAGLHINNQAVLVDGNAGLDFDHVWVEACVPYANYRGDGEGKQGYQWMPMDPSYETNKHIAGLKHDVKFDYNDFLSKRTPQLVHEIYEEAIEKSIKEKHPNKTVHDVGDRWEPIYRSFSHLPESLPYKVKQFSSWTSGNSQSTTSALPDSYRVKLSFEINGSQRATVNLIDMTQKRVTLSFAGSTPQAQQALQAWQQGKSGLTCPNSYTVNPVIKVDGQPISIANQQAIPLCQHNIFKPVTLKLATTVDGYDLGHVEYRNIQPLNYHAIQSYGFQASDQYLAKRNQRLLKALKANPNPWQNPDDVVGEYLDIVLLKYMRYINDATKRIAQLDNSTGWNGHHIGLTSTEANIRYVFNTPFALYSRGFLVDVPGGISRIADLETGKTNAETFKLAGMVGSQYESYIWQENALLDAVSTITGIQIAHQQNIPVQTFTDGNAFKKWAKACAPNTKPAGCYPPQAIDQLVNRLKTNGGKLTIPQYPIDYEGWVGLTSLYFLEDKANGKLSASFSIGQYSGGYAIPEMGINPNIVNEALGSGYNVVPEVQDSFWFDTTDHAWANAANGDTSKLNIKESSTLAPDLNSSTGSGINEGNIYSGDPVNMVTGNMYHKESDFILPARGLPIIFERHYNSRGKTDGPLSYGWTHSLNHSLVFIDGKSKDNKTSSVIWVDGSGAKRFIGVPASSANAAGITTLTKANAEIPKGYYFSFEKTAGGYKLTEKNGLSYLFSNVAGKVGDKAQLLSITDNNGNKLKLNYANNRLASVTAADNRQVNFSYDSKGHITQITDWSGNTYRYEYNHLGDLVRYFRPDNPKVAATTYSYYTEADGPNVNHSMKTFAYANGYKMTFEYYANGKAYRHYNALNETASFKYNDFRREAIFTSERGFSEHFFFNENALLIKKIDLNGGVHRFGFDDERDPFLRTSYTNPMGHKVSYHYDDQGSLVETTMASGSKVQYRYHNAFGSPGIVENARGDISLTLYNDKGQATDSVRFKKGFGAGINPTALTSDSLTQYADNIISWSRYRYNEWGNVVESRQVKDFNNPNSGPYTVFEYNDTTNKVKGVYPTSVTYYGDINGDGVIGEKEGYGPYFTEYDALGRPTKGVTGGFYPFEKTYNAIGQPTSHKDALGNKVAFQYDASGLPLSQNVADFVDGQYQIFSQQTLSYNKANRKVAVSNQTGATTRYQYDEVGNVVGITNPDGYVVQMVYNSGNQLIKAYDAEGNTISHDLDILGRKRSTTYPDGTQAQFVYYGADNNGWLKTTISPSPTSLTGKQTHYEYNKNGQVIKVSDQEGRSTLTEYDSLGRAIRVVSPVYDDKLLKRVRPVTRYTYNNLGFLTQVEAGYTNEAGDKSADQVSVQATYTYDDFGRKLTASNALGHTNKFEYDEHSNLIKSTDAEGQITLYQYDESGLLKSQRTQPDSDNELYQTYQYNRWGQLLRIANNEMALRYGYDAAHRLAEVEDTRAGKILSYQYSLGGLLNSISDNDGFQQQYQYDAVGRVSSVSLGNKRQVSYIYDEAGRLSHKLFPNNVQMAYSYFRDGSIKEIKTGVPGQTAIEAHSYNYNDRGNVSTYNHQVNGFIKDWRSYQYDGLNRLTQVIDRKRRASIHNRNNPKLAIDQINYDPFGNWRTREQWGKTLKYTHNALHQITKIDELDDAGEVKATTGEFSYDKNGNLISRKNGDDILTLHYNALDQLVKAERNSQLTETYRYGPTGKRIEKVSNGEQTRYHYAGPDIWAEYGNNWKQPKARYGYGIGIDDPLARITEQGVAYYHSDTLGSITSTTNTQGQVLGSQRFDAWGNQLATTGEAIRTYGYTGREPDATGLIYYRNRYYDPSVGRFTQLDPLGFVDGVNRYAYVMNNPVAYVDPWGTNSEAHTPNTSSSYLHTVGSFLMPNTFAEKTEGTWTGQMIGGAKAIYNEAKGLASMHPAGRVVNFLPDANIPANQRKGAATVEIVSLVGGPAKVAASSAARIGAKFTSKVGNLFKRGCKCCFAAGTPVLTASGKQSIETIEEGTLVYSKDPETGEVALKPITDRILTEGKPLYTLVLKNTEGEEETIEVTDNHPFWVIGKGWVDSAKLESGMQIEAFKGKSLEVVSLTEAGRTEDTYNLTVADFHTYYAGEQQAFVHNCDCITAGKNFKDHFIRHKKILEDQLGTKYPKFKKDSGRFLEDIGKVIQDGTVQYVGKSTAGKDQPLLNIYRGNGMTIATKENGEFVTLLESGKGMDIQFSQFMKE